MKIAARTLITLVLVLGASFSSISKADSGNDPITTIDLIASRLLADPASGLIYASITASDSVAVINPATFSVVKTLTVGPAPVGMSISPDGTKLYVALSGATQVGVINLMTLTVLPSLTVEQAPYEIEAGLGNRLYLTPAHEGVLLQVDATTGASQGTLYNTPYATSFLQISPDRNTLYFGDSLISSSTLKSFDVSSTTATLLQTADAGSTGNNGADLTLSHNGQLLCFPNYTGNGTGNSTDVIDPADFSVRYGSFMIQGPGPLAFSSDDTTTYKYQSNDNKIYLFSTQSFQQLGTLEVEHDYFDRHTAFDLVTDPAGRYLFLADDTAIWVYDLLADVAPSTAATVGQDFSYQAPIHIATTSASVTGLPAELTFDPMTRTISGVPAEDGSFAVVITGKDGTNTITVNLALSVFLDSRALNISTRAEVQTNDDVLIAGFIVQGTEDKIITIRAIGPSLPLTEALSDPTLELHDSTGAQIDFNDDWETDPFAYSLSFAGLAPTSSAEAALYRILRPGSYTAVIRSANGTSGVALAEVYDITSTQLTRLANISTRSRVDPGDKVMIAGVIVGGPDNAPMLIRALGPSLAVFGVNGSLTDPQVDLYDSQGTKLAYNDNWRDTQEAAIAATGLPPTDDRESAINISLAPGAYTAIVSGVGDTSGVALIEAYNLP